MFSYDLKRFLRASEVSYSDAAKRARVRPGSLYAVLGGAVPSPKTFGALDGVL